MATNNEYLEISHLSRSEVEFILKNTPQRTELFVNTKSKSDVWGNYRLIRVDGIPIADQCTCIRCKKVFSCSRNAGTSHLQRHQNSCGISDLCTQITLKQITKVKVKLSKEDTEAIKESQLAICTLGYQSFHSLESEGLRKFALTFVDLGAKRGRFEVSINDGTLFGRNAVQHLCLSKAALLQEKLKDTLYEPISASAVALTTDMWTDNSRKLSYLDVHAFWITDEFKLEHSLLAVEHFGTDSHTGDNILKHYSSIVEEYGLISVSAPVVTDKGSNMVAGLRDSPRLDCACHRLHTVFNDSYKETQNQCPKFKEYEDAACILCKYVKQATGIQETLPVSIKHGGNTRPWTSIYRRSHSINKSYVKLSEKLTERGRLPILAAVDKCLNDQVRDVAELFNDVFENLQYSRRPTINLVIPSYYKLSTMGAIDEEDSLEIAVLKSNIMQLLDEKFFSSITQLHWIATFLDPGFKSFSFLPNSTPADRKFKRDLLKDLPEWLATLAQTTSGATQESLPVAVSSIELSEPEIEEPPLKKAKSFFGSMRDNSQASLHTQNASLSLQEEYEKYLTGETTSDYVKRTL